MLSPPHVARSRMCLGSQWARHLGTLLGGGRRCTNDCPVPRGNKIPLFPAPAARAAMEGEMASTSSHLHHLHNFFLFFFNSFFHCFHALERFESLSTHKMQALQYWVLQHPQVAPSGPRAVPSLTPTPKRQALLNATSASSLGMQTPQPGNR